MKEIINRFEITLRDGSKREVEAGQIEIGSAGELRVLDVTWFFWNTFTRVTETIAPGAWESWVRCAK